MPSGIQCALKTDSVNGSLCSPESRADTLITIFFHCGEDDCMQIICKVSTAAKSWPGGGPEQALLAKVLGNHLPLLSVAQKSVSEGRRIFRSVFFGHVADSGLSILASPDKQN